MARCSCGQPATRIVVVTGPNGSVMELKYACKKDSKVYRVGDKDINTRKDRRVAAYRIPASLKL